MTLYQKQYIEIQFERANLFKRIRDKYQCIELLYPGSSVHITPSFYFPHVVYVDKSTTAVDFFADETAVLAHINRHKSYKRSAYMQFIAQDYTKPLPLREGQFDLLLALFAPDVVQPCLKYVKKGGLLVTNNFQDDALRAAADPDLRLLAVVQHRQGAYVLVEDEPENWLSRATTGKVKRYLRQASTGFQYVEAENYFVFEKQCS